MNQLFPPEIIKHSAQNTYLKHQFSRKWLSWALIVLILSLLAFITFFKVDVSVIASGVIRSPHENNEVFSVVNARVLKSSIKKNSTVTVGDTLVVLDDVGFSERLKITEKQLADNIAFMSDVQTLLDERGRINLHTTYYLRDYSLHDKELNILKENIRKLTVDYKRFKILYDQKVIPASEFEELEYELELSKKKLESAKQDWKIKWETDLKSYVEKEATLKSTIRNLSFSKDKYTILSNISGTVVEYSGLQSGDLVLDGMKIATISPEGDLIAECKVNTSDIGLIEKGMNVLIQVNAFNYNEWGMLSAEVNEISDDVQIFGDEVSFGVRCHLPQTYLELPNGVRGKFKKGMSLNGRFIVTQRTIFQLLFDKVDDWINPNVKENT